MASKCTDSALKDFLKFNDRETPEKMKEVAVRDLGETEELKEKCLKEMKALIKEHEVTCITENDFLLRFLRTKKFRVRESFERLQNYAKQRADSHEHLMALTPELLEKCLRQNVFGYLPYRDSEESLVFFTTVGRWNPSLCSDDEIFTAMTVLANYAADFEYSQLTGAVLIFDSTTIPVSQLPYLMRHVYAGNRFLFKTLPMRYRAFHSINENYLVKPVLRILDPFIPKKLKGRIYLHGKTRDNFFKKLPPCIIPNEYGGTLGPLNNDHLIDIMLNYLQKMKDDQRYFVKESDHTTSLVS